MTGAELRERRKSMGWTQSELAQKIGVSKGTVINYEKGKKIPESKHQILERVFVNADEEIYSLEKKVLKDNFEVLQREIQSKDFSSFVVEAVLNKFHPIEVVAYLDRHRDTYFELDEFRLLSKNAVGANDILQLKSEIKRIKQQLNAGGD